MLVLVLAVSAIDALGQNSISIRASMPKPVLTTGELGVLEIVARGGAIEDVPKLIEAKGLSINLQSQRKHKDDSIDGVGLSAAVINRYYYMVSATKSGGFEVPSLEFTIEGKRVTTQAIRVEIEPPLARIVEPTGEKFAILRVPEGKLYVNQVFPFNVQIYVNGRNSINGVYRRDLRHENFVIKKFTREDSSAVDLNGRVYSIATLPSSMFALRPGDHRVGPGEFQVKVYDLTRRVHFSQYSKLEKISSETIRIDVLPLPSGAPESFTGGVGSFDLKASTKPLDLVAGDPITIEFTITGVGNFETMQAPVPIGLEGKSWKSYEPKKDLRQESDGLNPGKSVFTQILIPLRKVSEIPAFELSYFDPKSESYLTKKTPAIPIVVRPDLDSVESSNVVQNVTGDDSVPSVVQPSVRFPDVLHIRTDTPKFTAYATEPRWPMVWIITNGVLAVLFISVLGGGLLRKLSARRQAQALEQGDAESFADAVRKLKLGMQREDFFHQAQCAFIIWEADKPDAPADVREMVAGLRGKCENALYSSAQNAGGKKRIKGSEANEYLKALKKLRR